MIERHPRRALSLLLQQSRHGWQLMGAVPETGPAPAQATRSVVRDGEDARLIRWQGCTLGLQPDSCDDYWFNVTSAQPLLIVICQPGHDGEPRPVAITVDQEDGVAASEVEEIVFQTPLPPQLVVWVRDYVAAHWTPGPRKHKRRRAATSDSDSDASGGGGGGGDRA